jgi:cellulose biosynthesis protein BcsQ
MATIIAIIGESFESGKSLAAQSLSVMRAMSGNKVVLIDADPQRVSFAWTKRRESAHLRPKVSARAIVSQSLGYELQDLRMRFTDIVIDTEARDCLSSRSALLAAHIAVISVRPLNLKPTAREKLVKRIASARQLNPDLRLIVAVRSNSIQMTEQETAAIRELVSEAPLAGAATALIHDGVSLLSTSRSGLSEAECRPEDKRMESELLDLYEEVYATKKSGHVVQVGGLSMQKK